MQNVTVQWVTIEVDPGDVMTMIVDMGIVVLVIVIVIAGTTVIVETLQLVTVIVDITVIRWSARCVQTQFLVTLDGQSCPSAYVRLLNNAAKISYFELWTTRTLHHKNLAVLIVSLIQAWTIYPFCVNHVQNLDHKSGVQNLHHKNSVQNLYLKNRVQILYHKNWQILLAFDHEPFPLLFTSCKK